MNLPLKKTDSTQEEELKELLKDPFLSRKYNRDRRIQDKLRFIQDLLPEVIEDSGLVIDIGPGPGEFLELCRFFGNDIFGFDADEKSVMGHPYWRLSRLLTQRQNIPVDYRGFEKILDEGLPFKDSSVRAVVSQGSIEQVFSRHIEGSPIDSQTMSWKKDGLMKETFRRLFDEVHRILTYRGVFLIWANGTVDNDWYNLFLLSSSVGFERLPNSDNYAVYRNTLHKFRKI